jgi:hypothetical protein
VSALTGNRAEVFNLLFYIPNISVFFFKSDTNQKNIGGILARFKIASTTLRRFSVYRAEIERMHGKKKGEMPASIVSTLKVKLPCA